MPVAILEQIRTPLPFPELGPRRISLYEERSPDAAASKSRAGGKTITTQPGPRRTVGPVD